MPRQQVAQPRRAQAYEREVIPEDEFLALEAALQLAERTHEARKLGSAKDHQCQQLDTSASGDLAGALKPCSAPENQREDSHAGARVPDIEDLAPSAVAPSLDAVAVLAGPTESAVGPTTGAAPQWRAMLGERPLDKRKSRGLSVTDLTASEWCEQRMSFVLTLGKPPPTEAMQSGSERHQSLEAEVVTVVEVEVQTREDVWALRFLNSVARMQQLWHDGLTRELLVVSRMGGVWLVGIIDEIRLRPFSLRTGSAATEPFAPISSPQAQPSQQDSTCCSRASMPASAELSRMDCSATGPGPNPAEPGTCSGPAPGTVESPVSAQSARGGCNLSQPQDPQHRALPAQSQAVPMDTSGDRSAAEGAPGSSNDSATRNVALGRAAPSSREVAEHGGDVREDRGTAPGPRKEQGKFPNDHELEMQERGADAPVHEAQGRGVLCDRPSAAEQGALVPLDSRLLHSPGGSEERLPRTALGVSRQLLGACGTAGPAGGLQWRALLVDTKTRWRPRPPRDAQSRNSRLQLMLYKKMFDSVASAGIPSADFCSAFFVDPNLGLSAEVVAYGATLLPDRPPHSLADVIKLFNYTARMMPPSDDSLLLRYEWQADGSLLGEDLFEYEEAWAEAVLQHHLQFWRGERMPHGVAEREGWKCDFCKFAHVCPVLASKAEKDQGQSPEPEVSAPT